jgi:alpha-mannosidase
MLDHRPRLEGLWHLKVLDAGGAEVPCQEEQPESLLPFNNWRRRISFVDDSPGVGVSRYRLQAVEIEEAEPKKGAGSPSKVRNAKSRPARIDLDSPLRSRLDLRTGLVSSVEPDGFARSLAGPLFEPLVIEDEADSWGTGHGSYRKVVGRFEPARGPMVIEQGPVRTITRSVLTSGRSRIVMDVVACPSWPVLEFRIRVAWNEERRRLKLGIPVALAAPSLLVEVPGGAIERSADGEEHVHGRWLVVAGKSAGQPAAIGVASSGQHGLDFKDGELRLSVLRSNAYCHERGFDLDREKGTPAWKFADIGVHEFRLLVTAGAPAAVKAMMPGLADHLAAPPAAYAHLPYDARRVGAVEALLTIKPASVRLLACKRSWDGEALIVRLQEAAGKKTKAKIQIVPMGGQNQERERSSERPVSFVPFEIKTLRIEKDGRAVPVRMIEEDRP